MHIWNIKSPRSILQHNHDFIKFTMEGLNVIQFQQDIWTQCNILLYFSTLNLSWIQEMRQSITTPLLTILPHLEETHNNKETQELTIIIIIRLFSSRPECIEMPLIWRINFWNIRSNFLTLSSSRSNGRRISHLLSFFTTTKATPGNSYAFPIVPLSTSDKCRFSIFRTTFFLQFHLITPRIFWVWALFWSLGWPCSLEPLLFMFLVILLSLDSSIDWAYTMSVAWVISSCSMEVRHSYFTRSATQSQIYSYHPSD